MPDPVLTLHHQTFGPDRSSPDVSHPAPLLLIHGGAGTIDAHFGGLVPALRVDRLVVGVELQGHGRTAHADRPYTAMNNVADLLAVLDRLELAQVDVLAFSNGCLTALPLAAGTPHRVRRMVLASGFARRSGMVPGFWGQFEDPDPTALPGDLAEAYRRIAPDPDALERMFGLDVMLMRGTRDWSDHELASLRVPLLFVSGDHDIVRPEHTLELARLVPDGRAAVLPAGHGDYLGTSDAPPRSRALVQATLALLRDFFDAD